MLNPRRTLGVQSGKKCRPCRTGGDALAFKNPDGSYVVVVYNEGAAKAGMVVAVAGTKVQFDMPANGWATVNYKP